MGVVRGGGRGKRGKKEVLAALGGAGRRVHPSLPLTAATWLHQVAPPRGNCRFFGVSKEVRWQSISGLRATQFGRDRALALLSRLRVCCPLPPLPSPSVPSQRWRAARRGRVLHSSTARTPTTTTIEQEAGSVSRTSSGGGSATTTGQPQTQNTDMMSSEAARKSAAGGTSFLGVQSRTTRIVMACLALICLLYLTTQSSVSSAKSLTRSARLMRKPIDYTSAHSSCGRTDDDKMIVLVTGAAGFVGMHTSLTLKASGHGVLGLDNFNDYYPVPLKRARQKALLAAGTLHTHGRSPSLPCRPTQSHSHSHNLHSYSRRVRRGARSCGRGCLC